MTTTPDHDVPPHRAWWKQPAVAAGAAVVVVVAIIVAVIAGRGDTTSDVEGQPTPTISAPPTATNLASPSAKAPTPTATAVPAGKTPKPVTVPLTATATPASAVSVSVPKVEQVTGEAEGVGEVAGPALRFSLALDNGTAKAIALGSVVVNAYYGTDKTPASSVSGPGAKPFAGSVAAGKTANGVYVFSVPKKSRDTVSVEFSYSTKASTVIFRGSAN